MLKRINPIFQSTHKNIFILSLLVYLITAYFSEGYHHPDEHFQILEMCNYKLGNSSAEVLPWEFAAQSRQALPVFIAFVISKVLYFFQITNPFTIAFVLRLITALFAWYVLFKLCLTLLHHIKTKAGKNIFIGMTMLLWFMPYLSVRFSSENLASITFLFAIHLLLKPREASFSKKATVLANAGILLGFCFFFRFQMGFAILGLGLWLLLIHKMNWKSMLLLLTSSIIAMALCVVIDYWFYGNWVLTPVNYFVTQIMHNVVSNWGVEPWWYYFYLYSIQVFPPLSIILFLFFVLGLYKNPKNLFVWILVPFILAHTAIGHKEMRFLFPMLFAFLYLAALGIDSFIIRQKYLRTGRFLLVLCLIINTPLLLAKMIIPAQEAISYYKFLYTYASKQEMVLLCREKSAYELVGNTVSFYQSPNIRCTIFKSDEEITEYLQNKALDSAIILERDLLPQSKFAGYSQENIYCLFPKWILRYNINGWENRARIWNIKVLRKSE